MESIGERLAYVRTTLLSMNQTDFSKMLKVSQGSLSEMEKNKRGIPMEAIIELMKYSKSDKRISCSWILTGEMEAESHSELNTYEIELLNTYNQLDRRGQHRVHTVIYEEIDRIEKSKQINTAAI